MFRFATAIYWNVYSHHQHTALPLPAGDPSCNETYLFRKLKNPKYGSGGQSSKNMVYCKI